MRPAQSSTAIPSTILVLSLSCMSPPPGSQPQSRWNRVSLAEILQLRLSTRIVDGIAVLDCAGRIVFGDESSLLRDTAKKMINENKRIVLNLSGVSYIDRGGLGTLVSLYTKAQKTGGPIKLANLTEPVGG